MIKSTCLAFLTKMPEELGYAKYRNKNIENTTQNPNCSHL